MTNQYFQYGDKALVEGSLYTVARSKHSTFPNGGQTWKYQLIAVDGSLLIIDGENWHQQVSLKKPQEGCGLTFRELMQDLKSIQQEWD